MGFSGDVIFGRSDRPLLEAPVFGSIRQEAGGTVRSWWPRRGGWQTLQFDHGLTAHPDAVLPAVVEWTGTAACFVSVHDSDVALVTGTAPGGKWWEACLNLEPAAALWAEEPEDVDDTSLWADTPGFAEAVRLKRAELESKVTSSAEGALTWAAAAGFGHGTEVTSIEELLRSREVFVEDLLTALLDGLGFPAAAPS